ncbi:MAG TPA: cation diffusion facilitator family transporter [Xanthomonadaceae bacterium]|nr:cation diffusion facilitator family transporter [Xanthomonadaceae bacterium]
MSPIPVHAHDHSHHDRGVGARRIGAALTIIVVVAVAELIGGWLSGSLALIADAAHMATDALALTLALLAARLEARPAGPRHSYGFRRAPVLAAFVNGLALFAIALWIVVEAVERWFAPQPVLGLPMLVIACIGLLANLAGLALLRGGDRQDLNVRGAILHMIGDLLGSVAAIAAAVVILSTGWTPIDPLLSVVVALLVLVSAARLLRDSAHVLLEGAPAHARTDIIEGELPRRVQGLASLHHVHVWSLSLRETLLTCHARLQSGADPDQVLAAMRRTLQADYGIAHATIEIEREICHDHSH